MSGSEAAEAMARIRAAGLDQAAGNRWSAEALSRLAGYVLTAGVETPELWRLARLGPTEDDEAQALFAAIVAEFS